MPVSEGEFKRLWALNTTATVARRNVFQEISAVTLQVPGIRGGPLPGAGRAVWYEVFIDVENIRGESIPSVFVLRPPDQEIQHVNVFHSGFCAELGQSLPHVCWGGYHDEWHRCEKHNRTLLSLVERLTVVLKNQNFNSPAR